MGRFFRRICCCRRRRRAQRSSSHPFLTPPSTRRCSFTTAVSEGDLEQAAEAVSRSESSDASPRALLQREICEAARCVRLQHAMDVAAPAASGRPLWRGGSIPGTRWWIRVARHQPRVETTVVGELETASQVAEMPMVRLTPQGDLQGAMLTILEFESWPQWLFMCEAAHVHRRWGPGEVLGDLSFVLPLGLRLEVTVYICLVDRLHDEGSLDVVVCSTGSKIGRAYASYGAPGTSDAGKCMSFLDVPMPQSRSKWRFRTDADLAVLRIYPSGCGGLQHNLSFVLVGEEKCPMDSLVCMIWSRLFRHLVPVLARYSTSGARRLESESDLSYYAALERGILAAAQRAEAQKLGEPDPAG